MRLAATATATALAASAVVSAEKLARRLAVASLEPLEPLNEPAWKMQRLRELTVEGKAPRTLLVGASVLDADIDPAIVETRASRLRPFFNACLTGSDINSFARWWRLLRNEVSPRVIVMEAHPLMTMEFEGCGKAIMASRLHQRLEALQAEISGVPIRKPAFPGLTRRILVDRDIVQAVRSLKAPSTLTEEQNTLGGWLHGFADQPVEDGLKRLPADWYEEMHIVPEVGADIDRYLDEAEAIASDGPKVIIAVSPLALDMSPSTIRGHHHYALCGDGLLERGPQRGFEVIDLRPHFSHADFADPFHLRSWGIERASRILADEVSARVSTPTLWGIRWPRKGRPNPAH